MALATRLSGKRATIFVDKQKQLHPLTQFALDLGAKVVEIEGGFLVKVQQQAQKYVEEQVGKNGVRAELLEFGGLQNAFVHLMYLQIKACLPPQLLENPPKRLWVTVGSATLFSVLRLIWPDTHFLCVQVGHWVDEELLKNASFELFIAPEKFFEPATQPPPFDSNLNYDAKMWQFIEKHGQHGDWIWNVAGNFDLKLANEKFKKQFSQQLETKPEIS